MPTTFNMSDVMISYSRRNKIFVQQLEQALRATGREIWVDWQDIPPTVDFLQEIYAGIEAANTFIFVISPDSAQSKVCGLEVEHAVSLHKRIIPILYRELSPEDRSKLHPQVASHNWINIREQDNFNDGFKTLLSALDTDMSHVQTHTKLLVLAREWENENRSGGFLLRGEELKDAENWLTTGLNRQPEPTALQAEYIAASRKASARRRQMVGAATTAALVIVSILALFAFQQSGAAQAALDISNQRGTEVANQNAIAVAALTQIKVEASTRIVAQKNADDNGTIAANSLFTAVSAQDLANSNLATATAAQGQAQDALATAKAAQASADAAQATAKAAQASADAAQATGVAAQNTAQSAQGTAQSNLETADAAQLTAQAAQGAANEAQSSAQAAQGTSNAAQASAQAAQSTASAANNRAVAAQAAANAASTDAAVKGAQAAAAQASANAASTQAAISKTEAAAAQQVAANAIATAEVVSDQAVSLKLSSAARVALSNGDKPLAVQLALQAADRTNVFKPVPALVVDTLRDVGYARGLRTTFDPLVASGVNTITFSPDNLWLVTGDMDGNLSFWDINPRSSTYSQKRYTYSISYNSSTPTSTPEPPYTCGKPKLPIASKKIVSIIYRSDDIILGQENGIVSILNWNGSQISLISQTNLLYMLPETNCSFHTHVSQTLAALALSPDGNFLAFAMNLIVYKDILQDIGIGIMDVKPSLDLSTPSSERTYIDSTRQNDIKNIMSLSFVYEGKSPSSYNLVFTYNEKNSNEHSSVGGTGFISQWNFLPDHPYFTPSTIPNKMSGNQTPVFTFPETKTSTTDGTSLLIGFMDGSIGMGNGHELSGRIMGHSGGIESIDAIKDRILSGSDDHTVRLWDITGQSLGIFTGHTGTVISVAIAPNEKWGASASSDGTIRLWDLKDGTDLGQNSNADVNTLIPWICSNRLFRPLTPAELTSYGLTANYVCKSFQPTSGDVSNQTGVVSIPEPISVEPTPAPTLTITLTETPTPEITLTPTETPTLDPSLPQVIDASDPQVSQQGSWQPIENAQAKGGSYLISGTADDSMTLTFQGTAISVIYFQHPAMGSFNLELDGTLLGSVRETGDTVVFRQVPIGGLTEGTHTLRFIVAQNPVVIDAFVVNPPIDWLPVSIVTATASPTLEITLTPSPTFDITLTPTATWTAGSTPDVTLTPSPTMTATDSLETTIPIATVNSATETPTPTAESTLDDQPTLSPTASLTPSFTPTFTDIPPTIEVITATSTDLPSATPTATLTLSPMETSTPILDLTVEVNSNQ